MFQPREELEKIGESFTEGQILDLILEILRDEFEPIRFAAERDPEISLTEIAITVRNMYANCVARVDGTTFLHRKGRESAVTASSGFKGSCDHCHKPGHKKAQSFKFPCESAEESLSSIDALRSSWGSLHNTHLHDIADCHAQPQQRGNGGDGGYTRGNNNRGIGSRRRHGGDYNTGRANTAVTANGTPSSAAIAPTPVASFTSQATPTPYNAIESSLPGIGFWFLAGSATPGPLKCTITLDFGASLHFVDSNVIGEIDSRMKNIVKLDPPATIVVAGHSTLSGISMGTLIVRVTDVQGFLHDLLLPAMNVPRLSRHLFPWRDGDIPRSKLNHRQGSILGRWSVQYTLTSRY